MLLGRLQEVRAGVPAKYPVAPLRCAPGGKYEYLLPAVHRKYDIFVTLNDDRDLFFELNDFEVKGDEGEIKLDFHLIPREEE